MGLDPMITEYYECTVEGTRLRANAEPRLEFLRTMELLDRFVPASSDVLDVGGGTGVYAVPLVAAGHRVRLVDPMPHHVEAAQAAGIDAVIGTAEGLTVGRDYDVVLLLGPLYHLVDGADRSQALANARAALRPGGVVVVAGISRHASLLDGMRDGLLDDATFRAIVERDLAEGQHRNPNPAATPGWFTTAYFHGPTELGEELRAAGFDDVVVLPVEGPGWLLEGRDGVRMEQLLVAARLAEAEPALLPASAHLLAVGRVPQPKNTSATA
jgi:SAM-dependent methyltransferase